MVQIVALNRCQPLNDYSRRSGSCIVLAQLALWLAPDDTQPVGVPAYSAVALPPRVGIAPRHPWGAVAGFLLHQTAAWPWKQKPWQLTGLMKNRMKCCRCCDGEKASVCNPWQHLQAVTHLLATAVLPEAAHVTEGDIMPLPCSDAHTHCKDFTGCTVASGCT